MCNTGGSVYIQPCASRGVKGGGVGCRVMCLACLLLLLLIT